MRSESVKRAGGAGTRPQSGDPASARSFPSTPVPGWGTRFPWLRAGTTRRTVGADRVSRPGDSVNAALAQSDRGIPALDDMLVLTAGNPWRSVVRNRQVHGSLTRIHADIPAGPQVVGEGDGHVTHVPGVLLTVTVADCVPVFIADPARRAVGLLHAGWRGVAAGVVRSGIEAMREAFGSSPADLAVHLGPAICGQCYEVGPEVFRALGEPAPATPRPIDLRRIIGRRAGVAGVCVERVTASSECTLCGDGRYYSHRRGDAGRQRAFVGIVA